MLLNDVDKKEKSQLVLNAGMVTLLDLLSWLTVAKRHTIWDKGVAFFFFFLCIIILETYTHCFEVKYILSFFPQSEYQTEDGMKAVQSIPLVQRHYDILVVGIHKGIWRN